MSTSLIQNFVVLGINTQPNCLRNAKDYSYMLANVVCCKRVLAVEKLLPAAARDDLTCKKKPIYRRKNSMPKRRSPLTCTMCRTRHQCGLPRVGRNTKSYVRTGSCRRIWLQRCNNCESTLSRPIDLLHRYDLSRLLRPQKDKSQRRGIPS
jgi:hypothetical protein